MKTADSGTLERIKQTRLPHVRAYYVIGLLIALILLIINFYSAISLISAQSNSEVLLDVGGRQRTYAQQIALQSASIKINIEDKNFEAARKNQLTLLNYVTNMAFNHNALTSGQVNGFKFQISENIYNMYNEPPIHMNQHLNKYFKMAIDIINANLFITPNIVDTQINYLIDDADKLTSDLNKIALQYDLEFSQKIELLKTTQIILFGILVSSIIFEGLFIFYPMEKKVIEREKDLTKQIEIRHKAQMELAQSQYSYRLLAANLPDTSILLFDKNLKFILADGPFLELFGYNKEVVEGCTLAEVIPKDIYEIFKDYYQAALRGEKTSFDRVSQHGLYYQTQIVPTYDQDGSITGGMAVTTDITERKKNEEKLQESESRFKQLVNSMRSAFWLASPSGDEIYYLSQGFEDLYGKNQVDLIKNQNLFNENIHPDDLELVNKDRIKRIHNNEYDVEYRIIINNEIRWIWSRAFAVRNNDGEIIRISGIIEDVTAKREFNRKAFQLEIEKKTINLLSDFIRDTAHDLRTPLTIIGTSSYLLKKVSNTEDQFRHIDMINKQVDRLKIIIEQLHSMSHIDGLVEFSDNKVNLSDILKNIYKQINFKARAKNISVNLVLGEESYYTTGDENYIFKAIYNICENAILYTPDNGRIDLLTRLENNHIITEVKDTGIGIDKDDIDKIFQRFYKVNQARTSNNSGSGLGLTMSKMIIERHSGRIEVDSQIGFGSTFKIYLPIETKRTD